MKSPYVARVSVFLLYQPLLHLGCTSRSSSCSSRSEFQIPSKWRVLVCSISLTFARPTEMFVPSLELRCKSARKMEILRRFCTISSLSKRDTSLKDNNKLQVQVSAWFSVLHVSVDRRFLERSSPACFVRITRRRIDI